MAQEYTIILLYTNLEISWEKLVLLIFVSFVDFILLKSQNSIGWRHSTAHGQLALPVFLPHTVHPLATFVNLPRGFRQSFLSAAMLSSFLLCLNLHQSLDNLWLEPFSLTMCLCYCVRMNRWTLIVNWLLTRIGILRLTVSEPTHFPLSDEECVEPEMEHFILRHEQHDGQ